MLELRHSHYWVEQGADTTINGLVYTRFNQAAAYSSHRYLREELDSGLVYAIVENDSQEFVLHDFNLIVGDTFTRTIGNDTFSRAVVTRDTVAVAGQNRLRLALNPIGGIGCQEDWIEGIGSSFGPHGISGDCWHTTHYLHCFKEDTAGQSVYPENSTCSPIGIEESPATEIRVFPNPATDQFRIESQGNAVLAVRLLNALGATFDLPVTNGNTYSISHLPTGIYWVTIDTDQGTEIRKLVKH